MFNQFPSFWRQSSKDGIVSNEKTNERELAKKLKSGDIKAIETIYTIYFDRLYAYVFNSVKRNQTAAEDIVQDTFLSALRSAKKFKGQSKIYTWLMGIAHHKIIDYYRLKQRNFYHNNNLINDISTDTQSIVDNNRLISENLETDETGSAVIEALSRLPLDYRQVLLFKYVEEMSVLEISQVMNRSPKSIEGLITRARRLLKENLSIKS